MDTYPIRSILIDGYELSVSVGTKKIHISAKTFGAYVMYREALTILTGQMKKPFHLITITILIIIKTVIMKYQFLVIITTE